MWYDPIFIMNYKTGISCCTLHTNGGHVSLVPGINPQYLHIRTYPIICNGLQFNCMINGFGKDAYRRREGGI